ncbi:ribonuclease H-like domain-containing protein [Bacillus massilinigeriensis]|uniref:ribonuclease H-like domain-containing protein n=1 Tax=Bacillus massilionigeriensis TaxID=1805475 RepID=UPI00096B394E|nr:ribonuclease H-like domain-containing protein [Bacillus massilionigeriensis]
MSIKSKLNRLRPHLSQNDESKVVNKSMEQGQDEKKSISGIPYIEKWQKENVSPYYFDGSYCLVKEVKYPLDAQHGKYQFRDFLTAIHAWNQTDFDHPLSARGFRPEDLFFFDTETTGLGGGTGNTIFLLGQASVQGDQIILKQHILPNPGAEVPFYNSFLEEIDYTTLVTYNGKAFDWPQVKTRHTLIREHVPKLPPFGHFDLYHASRRIWKHRLERLKLSIVEKEILGIEREDDVPGFLAPMIYFDFVENQNPDGMLGIMKHNEIDILSLITLYTHLTFQLLKLDQSQTSTEKFEIGKWYASLGEISAAKEVLSEVARGTEAISTQAKHALALEYKRQHSWDIAKGLWEEIALQNGTDIHVEACIELAKIYEHREKLYSKALSYALNANKLLQINENVGSNKTLRIKIDNEKRINRLQGKLNRLKDKL